MRFCDLMSVGEDLLNPTEQQKLRGKRFETEFDAISQNKMKLWKINQAIPLKRTSFLLGVCPSWNFYDLYLLDCINDSLKEINSDEHFEVVDVDSLSDLKDYRENLWRH